MACLPSVVGVLFTLWSALPVTPMPDWDPVMDLIVKPDSRWVEMVVKPVEHPIQELQVCVHLLTDITCKGKSDEMESPSSSKRFKIIGLEGNLTYQFSVRPLLHGYDEWKYKNYFVSPWPTGPSTVTPKPSTFEPTTSTAQPQKTVGEGAVVVVAALVVFVGIVVVVLVVCRHRISGWMKGPRPSLPFCCSPQAAIPIRVLALYTLDSEEFRQLVQAHLSFLGDHVHLEHKDCLRMTQQPDNPAHWLRDQCRSRRTLVYLSPLLTRQLTQQAADTEQINLDFNQGVNQINQGEQSVQAKILRELLSPASLKRGHKPIFLLSGCFQHWDESAEEFLSKSYHSLWRSHLFWISRRTDFQTLTDPRPLLEKLSCCPQRAVAPTTHNPNQRERLLNELDMAVHRVADNHHFNHPLLDNLPPFHSPRGDPDHPFPPDGDVDSVSVRKGPDPPVTFRMDSGISSHRRSSSACSSETSPILESGPWAAPETVPDTDSTITERFHELNKKSDWEHTRPLLHDHQEAVQNSAVRQPTNSQLAHPARQSHARLEENT